MLVDALDGKGHLAYGSLPDMTYVINPEGVIAFRRRWTDPKVVDEVIERLQKGEQKTVFQKTSTGISCREFV